MALSHCANDNLESLGHAPKIPSGPVSFSNNVQPIINKYQCVRCHGNDYYIYPGVQALAASGELYGSLSGTSYRIMPPSYVGHLTADELAIVKAWIDQGMLNN
jgi:hypothetical protein